MSLNIDDILAQLDEEKTAEAKLEEEISSTETEVEKTASTASTESDTEKEELEKTASDLEIQGRFLARGFYDELQKLATGEQEEKTTEKVASEQSKGFVDEVVNSLISKYK